MAADYYRFLSAEDASAVEAGKGWMNHFVEEIPLNARRLAALDTQIEMSDRARDAWRFGARSPWADFRRGVSRWFWEVA